MEQLLLFRHNHMQVQTLAYHWEVESAFPFQEEEHLSLLVLGMEEDIVGQLTSFNSQLMLSNLLVIIVLHLDMFTQHIGLPKSTSPLVLTTTPITTTNMICKICHNPIEPERLEILPTTACCAPCAHLHNFVKPRRGIMVFDSKTGGELQTMSHDAFESKKHYFTSISSSGFLKTE